MHEKYPSRIQTKKDGWSGQRLGGDGDENV